MNSLKNNLTQKTVHGFKWSYFSTMTNVVLTLAFTAVMARLLDPKAFGLVAMAGVILRFGTYFAQMGIGQALIQKKEIINEEIRAAFTSSLLLGLLFFSLFYLSAPIAVYIFNVPQLVSIIRVMAISFILTGLTTTSTSLLRRNLEFKKIGIIEIIAYLVGYGGLGITCAFLDFGVWSLVVAAISQSLLTAIFSYYCSRHAVLLLFDWKYYRALYSFGSRISIISFLEFLGASLDTLAIGHFLSASALGIYNRANMLVNRPLEYLTNSVSRVLFPSLSRMQSNSLRIKTAYLTTLTIAALILIPLCVLISFSAQEIVLIVLGPKWSDAVQILQILAIATSLNFLSHFGGILFDATATLNEKICIQFVYIIVLLAAFYFFKQYDLVGFAGAVLVASFIRNLLYLIFSQKVIRVTIIRLLGCYYYGVVPGVAIVSFIIIGRNLFQHSADAIIYSFFIKCVLASIVIIGWFFYEPKGTLKRICGEILINLYNIDTSRIRLSDNKDFVFRFLKLLRIY